MSNFTLLVYIPELKAYPIPFPAQQNSTFRDILIYARDYARELGTLPAGLHLDECKIYQCKVSVGAPSRSQKITQIY
jgi:hypothetical protein